MKELLKPSGKKCKCGSDISLGRVKFSKNPNVCIACDATARKGAYQKITGKTGHTYEVCDAETAAIIEKAQYRRGQSPGSAMKGQSKLY